jgi:outer membrane protein assembly factor BamE (lipoprotein component of BamABCDE complex)
MKKKFILISVLLMLILLLTSCKTYVPTQYTVITEDRKYYTDDVVQDTILNQIYFSENSCKGNLKQLIIIPFKQVKVIKSNYQTQ